MSQIRKVDWGLVLTALTLIGVLYGAYAKPAAWDQTVSDMKEIKPLVYANQTQLAVLLERLKSMDQHLASIDKKTGN